MQGVLSVGAKDCGIGVCDLGDSGDVLAVGEEVNFAIAATDRQDGSFRDML